MWHVFIYEKESEIKWSKKNETEYLNLKASILFVIIKL